MSDDLVKLIFSASQGDQKSLESIFEIYHQKIYYYAFKLCRGNEADAKDITQEVYVEIAKSIDKLRSPEYFNTWLARIIESKCKMLFRRNKDIYMDNDMLISMYDRSEQKIDYMPKDKFNKESDEQLIRNMMNELPKKYAEILDYYYFQQISIKDLSNYLNIPQGTVKSRLMLARKALKKKVHEFESLEHRKITFSLDNFSTSIFSFSLFTSIKNKLQHLDVLKSAQIVTATTFTVTAVTASAVTVNDFILHPKAEQPNNQSIAHRAMPQTPQEEPMNYASITYKEKTIMTPKSAYYVLMDWAGEKHQMELKSEQELQEILPVYDLLMENDSAYRDRIITTGWNDEFQGIRNR